METNNQKLAQRVQILEQQMNMLKQPNTIPLEVDRAFVSRGFLKEDVFITWGYGEISISNDFILIVPSATKDSIVLITPLSNTSGIAAEMRPSTTVDGRFEIYAQGVSGAGFVYTVMHFKTKPYSTL